MLPFLTSGMLFQGNQSLKLVEDGFESGHKGCRAFTNSPLQVERKLVHTFIQLALRQVAGMVVKGSQKQKTRSQPFSPRRSPTLRCSVARQAYPVNLVKIRGLASFSCFFSSAAMWRRIFRMKWRCLEGAPPEDISPKKPPLSAMLLPVYTSPGD